MASKSPGSPWDGKPTLTKWYSHFEMTRVTMESFICTYYMSSWHFRLRVEQVKHSLVSDPSKFTVPNLRCWSWFVCRCYGLHMVRSHQNSSGNVVLNLRGWGAATFMTGLPLSTGNELFLDSSPWELAGLKQGRSRCVASPAGGTCPVTPSTTLTKSEGPPQEPMQATHSWSSRALN